MMAASFKLQIIGIFNPLASVLSCNSQASGLFVKAPARIMSMTSTALTVDEARAMVREAGLRSTACRIAVLRYLASETKPVSHADVAEVLTPEGFDKSTVYRSLVEFSDAGLAARLELGDHVWRFEILREQHADIEHPHFMCLDCGKVECVTDVAIQIDQSPTNREVTEILLKGHCGCSQ